MDSARLQVAIVDDEDSVRKAIARLLRAEDMGVETYSCGSDLLAVIATHAIDCIILDLHMPTLTGFEILQRLAQMGSRVPVIVITGYDSPDAQAQVIADGAAAYLPKPVEQQVLLDAIAKATRDAAKR
jgi:FixJ family two-component response regulator